MKRICRYVCIGRTSVDPQRLLHRDDCNKESVLKCSNQEEKDNHTRNGSISWQLNESKLLKHLCFEGWLAYEMKVECNVFFFFFSPVFSHFCSG